MIPSELKIASLSDVHLGHPNTHTTSILKNLYDTFPDSSETGDLDIIFIVGDLFDRSLVLHDPVVNDIKRWMYRLLRLCKKRDIALRILEGTPSHDRRQSKMFEISNIEGKFDVDLQYVDTLSIEYISKFDIHILYVPDEWAHETDDVWMQVTALLQRYQLTQVDFTLLHGAMDYQLPEFVKSPKHVTDRYLSITKKAVFVGHVHKPSQRQHLFAHGSFSRLAHGEEEAKGHWRCTFTNSGDNKYTFVENVNAAVYKTIDCNEMNIDAAMSKLDVASILPDKSNIRIVAERGNVIFNSLDTLRRKYPHVRWTTDMSDDRKTTTQSNLLVDLRSQYQPIQLTAQNLKPILLERIRPQIVDDLLYQRCHERLQELV
jgi:DNA repair exonuclease SbcCD nuclease subunit